MSFLAVRRLSRRYGKVEAIRDVDLDVAAGGRTAIVGPSGSGKTTLLRLIAGFETPDSGAIELEGALLSDGAFATPAHRRGIGFVPQDGALFPHLTIARNIGFGLPRDFPRRQARIAELLEMVELDSSVLSRAPHELSGGQQQRVALARALARQPRLMLLDEPFSALDTGLRTATRKSVARMLDQAGVTTILVTHDQAEALSFADQVAVMRAGRLAQAGAPRDLYARPADEDIARFLGEAIVLEAELGGGFADCALGRIAARTLGRRGAGRIMLRPEQLHLRLSAPDAGSGAARAGEVTEIEFGGAACSARVKLAGEAASLVVPVSSHDLPCVGDPAWIEVAGEAHVFGLPPVSAP